MIIEVLRPKNLQDALALLMRDTPKTIPLGGGGGISQGSPDAIAVVDLQDIGLNQLECEQNQFTIGANAKLQALLEWKELPQGLRDVIAYEFTLNTRNTASLAGSFIRSTGRCSFTAAMLAVDSHLVWQPGEVEIPLGDWLPLRENWTKGKLITRIKLRAPERFCFRKVSRTPMHPPEVVVSLAQWLSGRTRLVIGGWGTHPICVYDGTETNGVKEAAINACSQFFLTSPAKTYQKAMIELLITRMLREAE